MSILGLQTHTEIAMSMDVFIKPQSKVPGYLADLLQPLQTGGKTQDTEECLFLLLHFLNNMVRGGTSCGAVWACNKQCSIESTSLFKCNNRGWAMTFARCSAVPKLSTNTKHTFWNVHPPRWMFLICTQRVSRPWYFFCFKHFCTNVVFEDMVDSCVKRHGHEVWGFLKLLM